MAAAYPLLRKDHGPGERVLDNALMYRAWAQSLCALRGATPPARQRALRVITQASVISDGVSEAGLPVELVAALFENFSDVDYLHHAHLRELKAADLPEDDRLNVLVSNQKGRYGATAAGAKVDLHLAIWNPFHTLDNPAPSVITWGYADGAMAVLKSWLEGQAPANAVPPVHLT